MMSLDSITSAMPPNNECGEEEEGLSEDSECEQEVWSEDINATQDEKEATKNWEDKVEEPKKGMIFDTSEDAYLFYCRYAKEKGFSVCRRTSKKGSDGKLKYLTLSCNRAGNARVKTSNLVKPRPQSKINCPAHIRVISRDGKFNLNRVILDHNHEQSPGKARYFKSNRVLDEHVKRRLELNDKAGIKMHKSYDLLQIEAGGRDKLPYLNKDCRNYLDKQRRLRLVEGDAEAMHRYFMKMKADNSNFFFAMDLDDKGRLRNVFWADARSRAACKEFGDVVAFDTTYLVNKHDMPFAPFVGVNHHGQSTLLGCGLISKEDTESFSWLFKTWMTCMWGCAPKAIITDQCMAMRNAIENVFPNTRHRWCIWHIMKKVPEKFSGYHAYQKISWSMRAAVYDSLTIEQFENAWAGFIKKYELESNTWLEGLYSERKRWVPAYLKDVFWAGMSSTQRSEGMNAYFDGYIHSKTTLKQFVEQYENALASKVESENLEDVKSWSTYIPCITKGELEKQFQSVYTHAKVKEFQEQFVGKLDCLCSKTKEDDIVSEYEVKQSITFGEREEAYMKEVSFIVNFNAKTNEAHCNCQLFEFRGMVCTHQLMVWHQMGIQRVPDKYVLRRWCKNVKRVHTKVRICYDKSSRSIEARRHDNMCNLFNDVADLAEESQEKCDMVMTRVRELKRELMEALVVVQSNVVSLGNDMSIQGNDSFSLRDEVIPSKRSTNILDPEGKERKGRPPTKRRINFMEKVVKKKRQTKKKALSNKKYKEIEEIAVGHHIETQVEKVEEIAVGDHIGTQESVANLNSHPSYMGHSMRPNMMPYNMPPNMAQVHKAF
ncbi:protein FAR1-RELATED SEQUENCE 5-like isoform X2 [Actinidia eriantha]|uniref:protein FAR1-RELATED SEQUENCE 5-like isoform X2 n=1 Tax=Actinidia eriantha TaxID=165200 RepID=UPI00258F76AA|nr:protein FAR1-RELATED SEQUENCE 5-like isoform X2 [Actinidia eriantha]XP_057493385.1 protein FAR1-RELATED SEQUENCE 5-like isoform X2 [Actinidia eriantha]